MEAKEANPSDEPRGYQGWFGTSWLLENENLATAEERFKAQVAGAQKWVFQIERCPDSGKLHFQWAARWKSQVRMSRIRKMFGEGHYQRLGADEDAIGYCTKPESRVAGPWMKGWFVPAPVYDIIADKGPLPWQKALMEEVSVWPASDRKVIWINDGEGGHGKNKLAKHMQLTKKGLALTGGSTGDLINGIYNWMYNAKGEQVADAPKVVMFCYSRPTKEAFMHYSAIEMVKDGMVTNSKYSVRTLLFDSPHLIIFCNSAPDYSKLTADKWDVREFNKDRELVAVKDPMLPFHTVSQPIHG